MVRSSLVSLLFFLVTFTSWGQVKNRYMVFFKDKEGLPGTISLSNPQSFLSQRAIDRRSKQGIDITEADLPVSPVYKAGVQSTGAQVFFSTRWMNGLLIQATEDLIPLIESLNYVERLEFVAPGEKLNGGGRKQSGLREKGTLTSTATDVQLSMIGLDSMHQEGNKGEGVIIGVFDGGFLGVDQTAPFVPTFNEGRIDLATSFDFVSNTTNVFQYHDHGSMVFSVIAAYKESAYTGGAYQANYQLFVTEDVDTEYRIEEYNWLFAAERADSAGVDVISSSLGYYSFDDASMDYPLSAMDGKTTVVSRAAQWAAERGIVVVCSAGNEGNVPSWRIISAPADAPDVIAVANVNSQGIKSSSSSIGPSADNRIKPDLAALGAGVSVIRANGSIGTASGTSLAAPLITSLVAGVWQRYPELSAKELVTVLKKTASQATNPDNELGYGIPNFVAVKNYMEIESQPTPFIVFPNPSGGIVYIRPNDPVKIPISTIEIVSTQGQLVGRQSVEFSWLNLTYSGDISSLAPGLYFLNILTGSQRFTFKLVKR